MSVLQGSAGAAARKAAVPAAAITNFGQGVSQGIGGILESSLELARNLKRPAGSG